MALILKPEHVAFLTNTDGSINYNKNFPPKAVLRRTGKLQYEVTLTLTLDATEENFGTGDKSLDDTKDYLISELGDITDGSNKPKFLSKDDTTGKAFVEAQSFLTTAIKVNHASS